MSGGGSADREPGGALNATRAGRLGHAAGRGWAFARRRATGDYEVDRYGLDPDLAERVIYPAFLPLYRDWFRVEVTGLENVPDTGGALIVGNHAGGLWAIDAVMVTLAIHQEHPAHRFLRSLAADLVFRAPVLGWMARAGGGAPARHPDADELLAAGELVGVWPEGFKGIGKPFRERYHLQRFGRGGFAVTALRAGAPMIPVSIMGSEETYPVLGHAKALARLLDLPYFPITPTFPWLGPLGLVPLPVKWRIEFGAAVPTTGLGPEAAESEDVVFELADRVRDTIQTTLDRMVTERRSIWAWNA
ncbi:MAG: 1-acyl-sn-glycerol-3-phosphate acyltransferase [Actinomycetia bacterium]|nr:1-acyl-sn-glycerol-3-phosphate acyltransferase [Actinomycetes bacterium]